ncbi:SDR family NAD(P)-dependent oxidoreductase [Alicyclobacillus dauci]|uniref:SDR family oxidoreductase n=1 Tax=Alicyclobacillus dauci TaxID=1475485 RepID=A0ABY6Z1J7_9BACL|nr:SDR family NAD(P)-dependent oxidoreductase [Alicyclobacillus dauci]WAH36463.1 SDR family oxidoreductase [Alicyclobacillus dauci]
MMKLNDKVAVITGGGRGIGRGIVLKFAEEGADLVVNVFNQSSSEIETLEKDVRNFGRKLHVVVGDVSLDETAEEIVSRAILEFGKIDILVNNAGILTQSELYNMDVEMWDRMIAVDLRSVFLTTRHAVPYMMERRSGRIINIASQLGQKGGVGLSHYAAAKAGVIGFTKSIALELGGYGITANCIAPGPIETDLISGLDSEWKQNKSRELAIPRFGSVAEVAPTALFLASEPDGNLYTGQTLGPNSGDVML